MVVPAGIMVATSSIGLFVDGAYWDTTWEAAAFRGHRRHDPFLVVPGWRARPPSRGAAGSRHGGMARRPVPQRRSHQRPGLGLMRFSDDEVAPLEAPSSPGEWNGFEPGRALGVQLGP